ncbi:ornithine cyclodeaminase domain protein [Mycobacterium xenopi 3993]|nr:ornithine cyclodeaminase domain protein [Mycobacterium xenopi 3993]
MSSPAASQPVQQILSREGVTLPVLTRSDLANIPVTPGDVIEAVRGAYLRVAKAPRWPSQDHDAFAPSGFGGLRDAWLRWRIACVSV